jgi:hypothetical protein
MKRIGLLLAAAIALPLAADAQVTPLPADRVADSVGMNVHPEFFANPPSVYSDPAYANIIQKQLIASGIRYVRSGAAAPSGDSPPHKAEYWAREKALNDAGIKLTITSSLTDASVISTDIASSGGWFQGEGANEPDLKESCATIISNQRALYTFRKSDPQTSGMPLLGPSLTITNPATWLMHCPTFAGIADIGNWHTYIHAVNPEAAGWDHTYFAHAQALYPSMPIYTTEYGYRSVQAGEVAGQNRTAGAPDAIIARYMPRWILTKLGLGYARSFIHQIADNHVPSPTDEQSGYGMIDYFGKIKPQWTAVKNLIAKFADPAQVTPVPLSYTVTRKSGNTTAATTMLFQRSDTKYMLAVWLGLPGWDGTTYTLTPIESEVVSVQLGTSVPSVKIDTFRDDGTVGTRAVVPVNGLFPMTATDHLQIVVF